MTLQSVKHFMETSWPGLLGAACAALILAAGYFVWKWLGSDNPAPTAEELEQAGFYDARGDCDE